MRIDAVPLCRCVIGDQRTRNKVVGFGFSRLHDDNKGDGDNGESDGGGGDDPEDFRLFRPRKAGPLQ